MYAVFEDGSRQYRVSEGDLVRIDYRDTAIGSDLELNRVLLYADDGEAAVAAAHARGLQPEQVLVRRSSLEDVFLRLTGRSLIE